MRWLDLRLMNNLINFQISYFNKVKKEYQNKVNF